MEKKRPCSEIFDIQFILKIQFILETKDNDNFALLTRLMSSNSSSISENLCLRKESDLTSSSSTSSNSPWKLLRFLVNNVSIFDFLKVLY